MPIPDDEQFEKYLRQFEPREAGPLPVATPQRSPARYWRYFITATLATAVLVVVLLIPRGRSKPPVAPQVRGLIGSEELATSPPLTLQQANGLLAASPSFTAALDKVIFRCPRRPPAPGSVSTLAALGKEDIKP